jgi:tripartite-type tricarboxylate transporter receptor subunit TctC
MLHPAEVVPHVRAGKARVLMVFEPRRDPLFPDAPTARELGHDITLGVYYLLIVPKGTPAAAVAALHDGARRALEEPAFVTLARGRGLEIDYLGPEGILQQLWESYRRNEALVGRLGLRK